MEACTGGEDRRTEQSAGLLSPNTLPHTQVHFVVLEMYDFFGRKGSVKKEKLEKRKERNRNITG